MSDQNTDNKAMSDDALQDLVASTDTGARAPGGLSSKILLGAALVWSLFQLWYASPLPFLVANIIPVLNDTQARSIHLAFAVFLAFLAYPAMKRSPRDRIPIQDWVMALAGAFCAGYLFLFYASLSDRPGNPNQMDLWTAGIGMVLLLEATRRALGPPLMVVATIFLLYVFFGHLAPDVIAWKGASFAKAMSHQWLTTEGVFGIALGVSTSFVFLFVLFGSLLDKAGAGNYFIKVAFSLLGHMRGGPAKAAVLSSGMTGLISGSSIANTVTTGTFTIPLMKRVGFPGEKAGAVEVASSVNGQIMPPVMGAAAFLMVEYVGISYVEVIKHAFLPAVISYIALLYIVHLEALKADMRGLPKRGAAKTLLQRVNGFAIGIVATAILVAAVYFGVGWVKQLFGDAAAYVIAVVVGVVYVGLMRFAAKYPELEMDDPNSPVVELPEFGPTSRTGLHFLLPIVVLIWCLMIERLSPGLSAFWASALMIFILLTQRPIYCAFRGDGDMGAAVSRGFAELIDGLIAGARNMIGIGVATAAAGIIVGTVSLTGIGQVMTEFVEVISGGNVILMLIFVAIISLILGMGLPTTANYIVVSSLMAGVVVELGAQSGLIVPLIAVHLFVFYFGIMADVTPPVGLASFAAAAVSGADPIKTGFQAFFYSMRTVALPFIFIFNTKLLLIGINGPIDLVVTIVVAVVAMLVFAAATQGFFVARSRIWESVALLLVAFTLFRPGYWLDQVQPPFEVYDGPQVFSVIEGIAGESDLRLLVEGEDMATGKMVSKQIILPIAADGDGVTRLSSAGLELRDEDGAMLVDNIGFDSAAEKAGLDFDWKVVSVKVPSERMPAEVFYLPAFLLLALIAFLQRGRRGRELATA
ncbi:MAG: TRAP transporter permease [Minwuiales bacterium]|nr:TRAP transporter permease [Minwuiales bacterium]